MKQELIFGTIKISFLKDQIIRIENSPNLNFSNCESINIKNKKKDYTNYDVKIEGSNYRIFYNGLVIAFDSLNLLSTFEIREEEKVVYRYRHVRTTGELPAVEKTPFVFPIMDYPRILVGEEAFSGYGEDCEFDKDTKDLFLLVCRNDYKLLRKQYISLTGNNEMPRLKNFGLWSSRWYPYTDTQALDLINKYNNHKIPLDNLVIDTDWRTGLDNKPGVGYEVNTKYFKNMQNFIIQAHQKGVELMFNDHPNPLDEEKTAIDREEIEYRRKNLTSYLAMGLDSWWYDRNWITSLVSPSKRVLPETIGNYTYYSITKGFYESLVIDQAVHIRPTFMSNLTQIVNGRYFEIADPREHTYAFQWSGDTSSDLASLNQEIANMIKCSNNMVGYYSSDIGGHMGNPTKGEFIRWYQYGCFSPILRPHCTQSVIRSRDPWVYDKKTTEIVKRYIDMRYHLLNVFYTEAFKHYENGLGITKPLNFVFPNDRKVNKNKNTYLLGDNILVAPISGHPKQLLSKREYVGKVYATFYKGDGFDGKKLKSKQFDVIDFDLEGKALLNGLPRNNTVRYITKVKVSENTNLQLFVSGEVKFFIDNKLVVNTCGKGEYFNGVIKELKRNRTYKIKVEYHSNTKTKGYLHLYTFKNANQKASKIYLPEGEWFDVFHRGVYQGKRYFKKKYSLEEVPLLVRGGALLPLYKTVSNISKMSLKEIVYDYYPSKTRRNDDFFFEDDGVTTGYQVGVYRKNNYSTYFDENENCYVIDLKKSENIVDDGLNFRKAFLKMHVFDGEFIEKATINGENVKVTRHDHKRKVIPFVDKDFASDSKTATIKFKQSIKQDYLIKLYIRK